MTASDRVLQFASLSFDASVEEIFPTLTCGGTLVLRSDRMVDSMQRFVRECTERAISVLDLPGVLARVGAGVRERRAGLAAVGAPGDHRR